MALSGGPMERTTLWESAYSRLRAAIIGGELEPGAKLGVYETAKALGTSRAPVQVALDLLAREGLVEVYRNSYSRVASVDKERTRKAVDVLTDVWTGARSPVPTEGRPGGGCSPERRHNPNGGDDSQPGRGIFRGRSGGASGELLQR